MRKNRFRWLSSSKPHYILAILVLCLASLFGLSSCADADGLHDQQAATVTFVFTNFPIKDGTYSIPGDYNDWDNTGSDIAIKDGEGTSGTVSVTSSSIEFSLVIPNDSSWIRPWAIKNGGTINGAGKVGPDYYRNFLAEGISLGTDVTITVDGSTETATVTVE